MIARSAQLKTMSAARSCCRVVPTNIDAGRASFCCDGTLWPTP